MNKVTLDYLHSRIRHEATQYIVTGPLTICVVTMQNGFKVVGTSACADPANFDAETGRRMAFAKAVEQLWPLEGYLLCQRRHENDLFKAGLAAEAARHGE